MNLVSVLNLVGVKVLNLLAVSEASPLVFKIKQSLPLGLLLWIVGYNMLLVKKKYSKSKTYLIPKEKMIKKKQDVIVYFLTHPSSKSLLDKHEGKNRFTHLCRQDIEEE